MSDSLRSDGSSPLKLMASRPRPDVCVVQLAGDLDLATAPVLGHYLREQTATRPTDLVLDLTAVRMLAAAGVALLVSALGDDAGIHGRLHLTGVVGNRIVERVLDLTGVRAALDVHESLEALLDELGRG